MTGLEVRAFRNEDNSVSLVVIIPPRRNGEANFGALARINRELLTVDPAAFDPAYEEQAVAHHAAEAPMPPLVELHEDDDSPEVALNWNVGQEHAP